MTQVTMIGFTKLENLNPLHKELEMGGRDNGRFCSEFSFKGHQPHTSVFMIHSYHCFSTQLQHDGSGGRGLIGRLFCLIVSNLH